MNYLCIGALLLLVGCATEPITTESAKGVSPSLYMEPTQGGGTVVIKRDTGFTGGACALRVMVNGKAIADLSPGEKTTIFLPPGEYIFGAEPVGICGGGLVESAGVVRQGETIVFRLSFGTSMDLKIQRTAM